MENSMLERFQILQKLGQGSYGEVFLAFDKRLGGRVAIKRMIIREEERDADGVPIETLKEIKILQAMNHENVVQIKEVFTFKNELRLVFEYMEHDLVGLMYCTRNKFSTGFSTPQVKCYLKQLLLGVHYLHVNRIIHRDIKAANILVNNAGRLKLADFGLATVREEHHCQPMSTNVVTLWYRAPEVLLGSQHYGTAIDMWAVGCVFAEMLIGWSILPGKDEQEQLQRIAYLCGTPDEMIWPGVSKLPNYAKFLKTAGQTQRPHLRDIYRNLDANALDLLDRMLTLDPKKRVTAFEALDSDYLWTDPMPCEPSALPKYQPSNEYRAQQANLQRSKRQCPQQEHLMHQPKKRQCQNTRLIK